MKTPATVVAGLAILVGVSGALAQQGAPKMYVTANKGQTKEQQSKGLVHFAGRADDVVIEVYPLPADAGSVDSSTRLGFAVEDVAEVVRVLKGSIHQGRQLPSAEPSGLANTTL